MAYDNIEYIAKHLKEFRFAYDPQKDINLKRERGIGLDQIAAHIIENGWVTLREHHNTDKYPHQLICEVEIGGYVYAVPIVVKEREAFLKTAYPSRKATKKHKARE